MDQRNFAIGVLSTTAAIMLVGLAVVSTRPTPVNAAGMTATGGNYIMTVATTPQTDEEYLYVVDVPAERMVVYRFDANRGLVDLVQAIDLSVFRDPSGQPPPGQPPGQLPGRP